MNYIKTDCDDCSSEVKGLIPSFMTSEAPLLPPMYGTGINWGNLTISGHSLGACNAEAMGYLYNVSRVVALAGSTDWPIGSSSYRWVKAFDSTRNTSANRFFGLVAFNEEAAQIIADNWKQTPFPGEVVAVPDRSNSANNYGYSHHFLQHSPLQLFLGSFFNWD